ncbi:MAG: Hsp20/alpha crystallin family protein [Candidatus Bathyarchaeota archaeon]|nr:MAG: Hsp20/alpha crystallin family protein [Candidatus Bathyarchaeota archaeon]
MPEEENKGEVKPSKKRVIERLYPSELAQAFDEFLEDRGKDFMRPWRPLRLRGGPWRRAWPIVTQRLEAYADLIDTGKEYQIYAEVPGIPKDKLEVTITKDDIEISGKTETESEREEEKEFIVRERSYREIFKSLTFPQEVIPEKAEATLKDGVLEVKIPKKSPSPKPKGHKVDIK